MGGEFQLDEGVQIGVGGRLQLDPRGADWDGRKVAVGWGGGGGYRLGWEEVGWGVGGLQIGVGGRLQLDEGVQIGVGEKWQLDEGVQIGVGGRWQLDGGGGVQIGVGGRWQLDGGGIDWGGRKVAVGWGGV